MLETIRKEWEAQLAVTLFLLYTFWWIIIHLLLPKTHFLYEYYGFSYGIIAVWGGLWALIISKKWGGLKSLMGRALALFGLGLFAQEFGQIAYWYYIYVKHVEIPYPSIGDIGFFGTIPFYILGSIFLARAAGVSISLRSMSTKIQAIIIPTLMVLVAYALFLRNYSFDLSAPLETFLTFGYPLGQAIYLSIAIFTYSATRNILGGVMKSKVLFFVGAFVAQFLADYVFLYFHDSYYSASIIDYLYVIAYFLMTLGVIQLLTVFNKLRHTT